MPGIYAAGVAIAPVEADRISSDGVHLVGSYRGLENRQCGFGFGLLFARRSSFRFAFLHAGGAWARGTQPCKGPVAGVAILPYNLDARTFRLVNADMLGIDGFAWKLVFWTGPFARDVFRDDADAFVAHNLFLHLNATRRLCTPPLKAKRL